jgi:hypothetical protein
LDSSGNALRGESPLFGAPLLNSTVSFTLAASLKVVCYMLDRSVCTKCVRDDNAFYHPELISFTVTLPEKDWLCPALSSGDGSYELVTIDDDPPKGCRCLMEQGIAAAQENKRVR